MAPQISEHCPNINPGLLIKSLAWFNRPGVASIFTPRLGIVQEWITSLPVVNKRILVFKGRIVRLSTSRRRNPWAFFNGSMNDSNSCCFISEYSYFQNHWCPIALIVKAGLIISSRR